MSSPADFDALPPDDAAALIAPCCASTRWIRELVDTRPHHDLAGLLRASDRTLAQLGWDDVLEALAAHPRIGRRAEGEGTEARWSRTEQAAAATDDADVTARLARANADYEDRFGWVFLIFATGKSPEDVLTAAERRLANDETAERHEVRDQLRQIVSLRLTRLFGGAS